MPKLIVPLMFLIAVPAQAQEWFDSEKPVVCGPFREIVTTLRDSKYDELPLWIGKSSQDKSRFSLFFNEKTTAWTLVQYGTTTGCILGIGTSSDIVNLAPFGERH